MPSRRTVLALLGATATAGCTSLLPTSDNNGFRLGELWVLNSHDDLESVSLTLTRGSETLFEEELALDATERYVVNPVWSTAPATYSLTYGPAGQEVTYELTAAEDESGEGGCTFVTVQNQPSRDVWGHFTHSSQDHPWSPTYPE